MAFCPNCEAEYRPEVRVCPDCEIELVSELTAENKLHDDRDLKFAPLGSFKDETEAQMFVELLEQNGVPAFIREGAAGIFGAAFVGGAVMVPDDDLARAQEIYEAYFSSASTAPAEEDQ
jgi:putative signal transducing protein